MTNFTCLCRVGYHFWLICEVEEPEVRFNMDQYTDVTRVTKPVIYISIAEIIDTHKVRGVLHLMYMYKYTCKLMASACTLVDVTFSA